MNKLATIRRMTLLPLLGISSALPLGLTGSTLQAWYTQAGVSTLGIGLLTLVGQPYLYKFLWAPLLDRYQLPFLGRRRGWMLVTQLSLSFSLGIMGLLAPQCHPVGLASIALLVAFISASQDIVLDAYRTDVLSIPERGLGSSLFVAGCRIALLIAGGLALILADHLGWKITYLSMAALMLLGVLATLCGEEPPITLEFPQTLKAYLIEPFKVFFKREAAWALLLLIVLYKFGDALSQALNTTFLLRGLQLSLSEVGVINKMVGLAGTLLGALLAGFLLLRIRLFTALLVFGLLQSLAILLFVLLAKIGKLYPLVIIAVAAENFFMGMSTTAFVVFLMSLCDHRYTATHYALLSALAAIGRVLTGPLAGWLLEYMDWAQFYAWSAVATLPGLLLLWVLREKVDNITRSEI